MPRSDRVSIQQQTKGAVTEFLERECSESLPAIKLLCYLCGALQRYEEEGELLDPKILFCASIEEFIKIAPGGRVIKIGRAEFNERAGKQLLKECATLAQSGWHIFCQPSDRDKIEFGVFSSNESPTSLSIQELLDLETPIGKDDPRSILIEKLHDKEVVLKSSSGNSLSIAFSTSQEASFDIDAINRFCGHCVSAINNDAYSAYFSKMIMRCLGDCHGTILICVENGVDAASLGLADGIVLDAPIELWPSFNAYSASSSADAVLELQRMESLLKGFLNSDGVVVLDTSGSLVGYRMFFQRNVIPPPSTTKTVKTAVVGGARRRAYEGIKTHVGKGVIAALFRSQDGVIECQGK